MTRFFKRFDVVLMLFFEWCYGISGVLTSDTSMVDSFVQPQPKDTGEQEQLYDNVNFLLMFFFSKVWLLCYSFYKCSLNNKIIKFAGK